MEIGQELNMDQKNWVSAWMKTFFFRSPKFGLKNRPNFGEDLFFWRSSEFGLKNRLNLSEDQRKSGSRSFDVVSKLQNSPPMQIPGYAHDSHDSFLMNPRKVLSSYTFSNLTYQLYICFGIFQQGSSDGFLHFIAY